MQSGHVSERTVFQHHKIIITTHNWHEWRSENYLSQLKYNTHLQIRLYIKAGKKKMNYI